MLESLKCILLNYGYEQVQLENLMMSCPEVENNRSVLNKAFTYHWLLNFECDISSELECEIQAFISKYPCSNEVCSSSCSTISITYVPTLTSCEPISIQPVDDP